MKYLTIIKLYHIWTILPYSNPDLPHLKYFTIFQLYISSILQNFSFTASHLALFLPYYSLATSDVFDHIPSLYLKYCTILQLCHTSSTLPYSSITTSEYFTTSRFTTYYVFYHINFITSQCISALLHFKYLPYSSFTTY